MPIQLKDTYPLLTSDQLQAYLLRLSLSPGEIRNSPRNRALLDKLIYAHQMSVPFENISVYTQDLPISLALSDLYDKIITRGRGGYCFELNGLFISLLKSLGYDAWSCYCRVAHGDDHYTPVTHRASIARINGQLYYCDVGFGGPMPAGALLIEDGLHQQIDGEEFYVEDLHNGCYALLRQRKGKADTYDPEMEAGEQLVLVFQTVFTDNSDYEAFNMQLSQDPEGYFRKVYLINQKTPNGYRAVTDFTYTEKENETVTKKILKNEEERNKVIESSFGIPAKTLSKNRQSSVTF